MAAAPDAPRSNGAAMPPTAAAGVESAKGDASDDPKKNGSSLLPALTLPKGGGAIRGIGEKFSVNAATGTASLSVPLAVSPGRGGAGPAVSLSYDSGGGNGPFGLGFSLSVPSITRKTDQGLPRYYDEAESDEYLLSGAEDLVVTRDAGGEIVELTRAVSGVNYRVRRYRPRTEGLFANIERWTHPDTRDVHWRVTTKDNTTHVYGTSEASRIVDPLDDRRIFTWLIDETRDDKGNVTRYVYKAEDGVGVDPTSPSEKSRFDYSAGTPQFLATSQRYLKRVFYGNRTPYAPSLGAPTTEADFLFELVFDYGEHPPHPTTEAAVPEPAATVAWPVREDPFSSYRAGFEVRTYRLCRRVLMFHRFTTTPLLVKSTDFTYEPGPAFTYLTGVTQCGYLNDTTTGNVWRRDRMPTLALDYARPTLHDELEALPKESLEGLEGGVDGSRKQWVDLDGEGIPGVLIDSDYAWYYKANRGAGELTPPRVLSNMPSPAALAGGVQQLEDLGGDGQLDLVSFDSPLAGYFTRTAEGGFETLRNFETLPNIDFRDPNLRSIDLDGDGFPDLLITEDHAFVWYRSRGKAGFEAAERLVVPSDDDKGPAVVFADSEQSIQLADMSGDGLVDIVRIRNGEVSYWPNLGYGRFGKKITLENSPIFASPDQFDARRIRFGDVDGSGTSDLFYLGSSSTVLYYNFSGNRLSPATPITSLPPVDNVTSLSLVDLLGNGTTTLVWSSPLPSARSVFYVDLMGGVKPHLLTSVKNNLGAETTITYASSTKFYLEDRRDPATAWLTRLSFPVQVVERLERFDHISKSRLVSTYRYRHGFYDGVEREFRGFARVEQRDAEEFTVGADTELFQAPVRTVTWFHTGAWLEKERLERELAKEYFPDPGNKHLVPDTVLPSDLTIQDEREAARVLRGSMLRQEVYAEDAEVTGDLEKSLRPYVITEQNFEVKLLQPSRGGLHAVFFSHPRESVAVHLERNPSDPRIAHDFTLDVDPFGNVKRKASITYARANVPERIVPEQAIVWATLNLTDYINHPAQEADDADEQWHRIGVEFETCSYELTGLPAPTGTPPMLSFESVDAAIQTLLDGLNATNDLPYEAPRPGADAPRRRLLDHKQQLFYNDALTAPLALGQLESLALPYETYQLALTTGLVNEISVQASLLTGVATSAGDIATIFLGDGGYVQRDAHYWAPSGRVIFDATRFYLPIEAIDPFLNEADPTQRYFAAYDAFSLLITDTRDPLGNVVHAENDYRVLAPSELTDPNLNRVAARFDALGMVERTAVMGKATGPDEGDTLENPTTRLEYDLLRYENSAEPAFVHTFAREVHFAESAATRFQESFAYSDGFGRIAMQKVQAEPGEVPGMTGTVDPRWVGTGRTVFNNKGNPVKQYEPFFSATSDFEDEDAIVATGVTPIIHYDPLDRVVRTEFPDGSESRVEFDAWLQRSFDQNDAIQNTRWLTEHQAGTPDEQRAAVLTLAHANTPTLTHLDTLGRAFLVQADNGPDPSNPTGPTRHYDTRSALDIEGNVTAIVDARGNTTIQQRFDVLARRILVQSPDAGARLAVADVAGKPLRGWDTRAQTIRPRYDALQRPTHTYVRKGSSSERLLLRTVYGESLDPAGVPTPTSPAQQQNLRGKPHHLYDCAGLVTNATFDFKGNLLASNRRLAVDYQNEPDWLVTDSASPATPSAILAAAETANLLESEAFDTETTYDALNRVATLTTDDNSVTVPTYNIAGLLEQVRVGVRGATPRLVIRDIDYNARGQRTLCEYTNPETEALTTSITYTYDDDTFRLTTLVTTRGGTELQHLVYTYDPVGNIVALRSSADTPYFTGTPLVSGDGFYAYDPIYRLTEARGREHPGQTGISTQPGPFELAPGSVPHANDIQALIKYTETYLYDEVGNIERIQHTTQNFDNTQGPAWTQWTRRYQTAPDSNRLLATSDAGDPDGTYSVPYEYSTTASNDGGLHGSITGMPHLPGGMFWDYADRLKRADRGGGGIVHFTYDAAGQRVRKVLVLPGTIRERIYLGGYELYRERPNTPNAPHDFERQTLHVMDDQRRVAMVETKTREAGTDIALPVNLWRFQLDNHLGSSTVELDHAGLVISYEEYHPYGSTAFHAASTGSGVSAKRYRYTSKERDEETGFYYHGARYYAPWLGRWTAVDPAGLVDGPNLYGYARANPAQLRDPSGTQAEGDLRPGTANYAVGTRTDAQLFTHLKSLSAEQRTALRDESTGAFRARVNAFLSKYALEQSYAFPEERIVGSVPPAPAYSGPSIRASTPEEIAALDRRSTFDKALDATAEFFRGDIGASLAVEMVRGVKSDVEALAAQPEEKEFLGAEGRVVKFTVRPDPARKAEALGNLFLLVTPAAEARAGQAAVKGLNSSNALSSIERASPELLEAVGRKRTVEFARPGSEELRYLDTVGAEANVGGPTLEHILLRENPGKAAVLEEFLHGTQSRLGIVERLGVQGAETHVKDFMIRHQKMLGLSNEDVAILRQLRDMGL
jgi:RHS repeat-associated protein